MTKASFIAPVATISCSGYNGYQTGHGRHKSERDYNRKRDKGKLRKEFASYMR